MNLPTKICVACGRSFAWRKKWERDWDQVKFCSNSCRRQGDPGAEEDRLEQAILDLLGKRTGRATICPSEVARRLAPDDWRPLMEPLRRAARRLVAEGRLHILQNGRPANPDHVRGPIRLRAVQHPDPSAR